jgi:uroporphyrinogen-III synthase
MPRKIIIIRHEKTAAPLIASLKERGLSAYAVPVTRIVYHLSKKLPSDINNFDWIAFTSANGVRGFAEILSKSGYKLEDNLRIAAVGSSTAAEVENQLGKKSIVPEINKGESLGLL